MGFGVVGAASGASNALEEILAQQMVRAQMMQRAKQEADQLALQTRQIEGVEQDRATNRALQTRTRDLAEQQYRDGQAQQATDRNIGLDAANVLSMPGMDNAAKAQELTSSVLRNPNASSASGMLKTIEGLTRKPERDPIADHEAKARIDAKYRAKPVGQGSTPDQVFVMRGGKVVPITKGTAQPGDTPYDAVAARTSAPVNKDEAMDTAREAKRIATALRDHKGFNGAFGVMDSVMPTFRQDTADAESLRDTLTSLLTMENMGKMKGVLSDSDMKVLRQASSTINSRMSESAAKAELNRIIQVMGAVDGGAAPAQTGGDDPVAALLKKYGGG